MFDPTESANNRKRKKHTTRVYNTDQEQSLSPRGKHRIESTTPEERESPDDFLAKSFFCRQESLTAESVVREGEVIKQEEAPSPERLKECPEVERRPPEAKGVVVVVVVVVGGGGSRLLVHSSRLAA